VPAQVGGEPWEGDNPRLAIPRPWHDFVRLWATCRGESGVAHWPDQGGVGDQAAWIVDAFATLAGLDARWREDERKARG
jgi:hypothetical protein